MNRHTTVPFGAVVTQLGRLLLSKLSVSLGMVCTLAVYCLPRIFSICFPMPIEGSGYIGDVVRNGNLAFANGQVWRTPQCNVSPLRY